MVGVLAASVVAFLSLFDNGFVNWDDPFTLLHNEHLAAPGVFTWAFTTNHMGHYQPLAWLAWFQVKARFGLNPVVFHGLSLLGHLANAGLVYLLSIRLATLAALEQKSTQLAALFASALFAIHPIRVEVVAWASAFPYILSLWWLLLSLLAYLTYCTSSTTITRRGWFTLSVCCYALSLLSRAAGLGFPLVLLVLDAYPLRRFGRPSGASPSDSTRIPHQGQQPWRGLLVEKVPFLLMAFLAALVESRSREVAGLLEVGLGARLTMAATAPFVYLGRTLLPIGRTPIDPLPIAPELQRGPLLLSLVGLVVITTVASRLRFRWTVFSIAWWAFLLLLAPVVGLIPSGQQATADRYMYFPGVVLSVLAGGLVAALPHRFRQISILAMLGLTGILGVATWRQTRWWHDSITLWTRAADLDPQNDIATYNLAIALEEAGRETEAVGRYEQTLRLVPDHAPARHNLRLIHAAQATRQGDELAAAGRADEAIEQYSRALALDANRLHAQSARGIALMRRGRFADAVGDLRVALAKRPDDVALANALAFALVQTEQSDEAAAVLKQALAHHPNDQDLAHNLSRVLATASDPAVRDGPLALRLALAVRDRAGGRDPRVLDTLAAAYAETGQFDLAEKTADEAVALARQLGDLDMAREIDARSRRYRNRRLGIRDRQP